MRHVGALGERGIERIDVVLLRFAVEGGLQFLELGGILRGEVVRLREVLRDVVQLPLEVVRVGLGAPGGLAQGRRSGVVLAIQPSS